MTVLGCVFTLSIVNGLFHSYLGWVFCLMFFIVKRRLLRHFSPKEGLTNIPEAVSISSMEVVYNI
jgi:hypothetical protein